MAVWSALRTDELRGSFRLDAEFWRSEYLDIEAAVRRLKHKPLGKLALSIRKGAFNILADSYTESGIPFYRSANVGTIVPNDADLVFISAERHREEYKTRLRRGDLMLAKCPFWKGDPAGLRG